MSDPSFALVTISYAPDFERCATLAQSVREFVDPSVKHYIAVDRRDLAMFQPLANEQTEVFAVESILPWWLFRVRLAKRWWLSLKTRPVRNWVLQQAVKLSLPLHLNEDVLLFVDSDVMFVRPFSPQAFMRGNDVRLFRIPGEGNLESQHPWHQAAGRLLGLPPKDYFGARYIGNIVSWRRDVALKLHAQIEKATGRPWLEAVLSQWHLSEYILYGVFVDQVLKGETGHWHDENSACLEYWDTRPLSVEGMQEFLQMLRPEHFAVMVSAKAGMPASMYRDLVQAASLTGMTC